MEEKKPFKSFTIFRVVGGNSQRSTMNDYEIIPYLVINETPRYYTTSHEGCTQLQQKRTTSNSEFFLDVEDAQKALLKRIDDALEAIHESWQEVERTSCDGIPMHARLYVGKFNGKNKNKERFSVTCHQILRTTNNAWYIHTNETKEVDRKNAHGQFVKKQVPVGRCYIYQHPSGPHDPSHPFEKWITTSRSILLNLMKHYYEDRVRYLNNARAKQRDWIRNYREERGRREESL